MSPSIRYVCAAVLAASFLGCSADPEQHEAGMSANLEFDLIGKILKTEDASARAWLITELEAIPVDHIPFYDRWIRIHDPWALECWTDNGYDPSLSKVPPDAHMIPSVMYGKSDIDNGGLHQFFANGTGVMAPEMQQWCERAGLPQTAEVLREAIAVFGDEFPRSQEARQGFLMEYAKANEAKGGRNSWNPFAELDDRFYKSTEQFDDTADRWLRDVCGVTSLHQAPSGITKR
ncbi:MAG: DUF4375 domain-containing protein [Planctomycetaceae bacterium]